MCKQRLFYFFPIQMPFISFYWMTALPTTTITMLNRCGEGGHTCLVPDLRGKAFSLSPLSIM